MQRTRGLIGAALVVAGTTVLVPTSPASAAITTSVSGGKVTVTVTGDTSVGFQCGSKGVTVNGVPTSPTVACSAFTGVIVNADDGDQTVYGAALGPPNLPSVTGNTFSMGGGDDTVEAGRAPDAIDMGSGDDWVQLSTDGAADPSISMGGSPADFLMLIGTEAPESFVAASTTGAGTVTTKANGAPAIVRPYQGVGSLYLDGREGDDLLDASGLQTAALTRLQLMGGGGNDSLKGGSPPSIMDGSFGTNTFDGGSGPDQITTRSQTDVIRPGGGANEITDTYANYGGRSVVGGGGGSDGYGTMLSDSDAVWRLRPTAGGGTRATASLNRPGIALLPSSVDRVGVILSRTSEKRDHSMADIVASPGTDVTVSDTIKRSALIDITIPTGSWTTSGTIGNGSGVVDPTAPGLGTITLTEVGTVSVHGPWTDERRGWAHRATRDLLFRFADGPTLDAIQAQLAAGTPRATATAAIVGSDEYRGLDVDRVFVKYLRRPADPGGRTYWIGSIRKGKALWRFRAQLFGSNEYFENSGSKNSSYVTRAYADVLGRSPDPSGLAYWTGKLDGGADRGSVALQFINSPEARRRLVDDQYLRFLDRLPTSGEQTAWVAKIPQATGEQQLIASLVSSQEYADRT